MSQNRAGLTFEALIHENKKRPNNRLQKLLEQKLFILKSMKDESDRMYRKEKRDLITRQKIYDRILGSLTHTYSTAESRNKTRMSEVLNNDWDPLNVQGILRDQGILKGLYGLAHDEIDPEDSTPKHDRKRLSTNGAFGVKKRNTKSNPEEDKEVVEEEKEEVVVPVPKKTWKDALREIKEQSLIKSSICKVQINTEPSEIPEKTFVSEVLDEEEIELPNVKLLLKDESTTMSRQMSRQSLKDVDLNDEAKITKFPHIENGPMAKVHV